MVVIANFREAQYPEVEGTRCIKVYVPNDDAFLGLLAGLLALPGNETNYQQEDIDKASALAQQWRNAYVLTDWIECETPVANFPGEVKIMATTFLPDGWLYCDGDEVAKATYPDLWNAITNFWGTASNPTDNFLLPDFRNRTLIGYSGNASAPVFASYGGEEDVTLTTAQIPSHNHAAPVSGAASGAVGNTAVYGAGLFLDPKLNTDNAGGGAPHNNMPPYGAVSYIIYTGA